MHKPKRVMDTAEDGHTFAVARKHYLARVGEISCSICGYHHGENKERKNQKSWKKKRKFQTKRRRLPLDKTKIVW